MWRVLTLLFLPLGMAIRFTLGQAPSVWQLHEKLTNVLTQALTKVRGRHSGRLGCPHAGATPKTEVPEVKVQYVVVHSVRTEYVFLPPVLYVPQLVYPPQEENYLPKAEDYLPKGEYLPKEEDYLPREDCLPKEEEEEFCRPKKGSCRGGS